MSIRCCVALSLGFAVAACTTLSSSPSPRYRVCVVEGEERCGAIDDHGELQVPLE